MPPGSVVGVNCRIGSKLFFWGVIVSLAEAAADGVVEALEGTTDGVTVGEGLQAASRRMIGIPRFFEYI